MFQVKKGTLKVVGHFLFFEKEFVKALSFMLKECMANESSASRFATSSFCNFPSLKPDTPKNKIQSIEKVDKAKYN